MRAIKKIDIVTLLDLSWGKSALVKGDKIINTLVGLVGDQLIEDLPIQYTFAQDGFYPEMLPQQAAVGAVMAEQMKETPMYKSYVAIAPHPKEFPKLLDARGAYMRKSWDWSTDVKKLTMPVLLIYGDSDMIRPEHIVKFYQLLGGGLKDAGWQREHMSPNRLAILPNLTHYEMGVAPQLIDTALPFLNGAGNSKSWSAQVGGK